MTFVQWEGGEGRYTCILHFLFNCEKKQLFVLEIFHVFEKARSHFLVKKGKKRKKEKKGEQYRGFAPNTINTNNQQYLQELLFNTLDIVQNIAKF